MDGAPERYPSPPRAPTGPVGLGGYVAATAIIGTTTLGCYAFRGRLQPTDVAMLYLLAVVVVASFCRRGPSVLATALSILLFDLVFVPPFGTFDVHDTAYFLTFAMMFVVAIVMTGLTARIREGAEEAEARERRTATLYDMSRELASASTAAQVAAVVERHLGMAVRGAAAFAPADPSEGPEGLAFPAAPLFGDPRVRDAARWVQAWDLPAGATTAEFGDLHVLLLPVRAALTRHGVVAVGGEALDELELTDRRTLELLVRQTALALERLALSEQREAAEVAVEAERLRGTLLSSISHDLRTPLASIEGSGTALLDGDPTFSAVGRRDLLETIVEEAQRMTRMVNNLLDMVRVESGTVTTRKAWVPIEEVVGVARLRLDTLLADRPVEVRLPADPLLVAIDELLMEQVVVNLLENAARYTPPGTPVTIAAWQSGAEVIVEVADRGPGIPVGEEEAVFRKFYRLGALRPATNGASAGTGLGLAICRGVVMAHGGRIWVEGRPGGGASFRFALPADPPPPAASTAE